jgi:hypothetical protein
LKIKLKSGNTSPTWTKIEQCFLKLWQWLVPSTLRRSVTSQEWYLYSSSITITQIEFRQWITIDQVSPLLWVLTFELLRKINFSSLCQLCRITFILLFQLFLNSLCQLSTLNQLSSWGILIRSRPMWQMISFLR